MKITFQKPVYSNRHTFYRRFPNDWNYSQGNRPNFNATYIESLQPQHTGMYIAGMVESETWNDGTKDHLQESYGAYFEIIGRGRSKRKFLVTNFYFSKMELTILA